jgi:hypothetical protein
MRDNGLRNGHFDPRDRLHLDGEMFNIVEPGVVSR